MFNRVRWRLTAWYVGILLLIVIATTAISYAMLANALRSEVDDSLRDSARNVAAQLNEEVLERAVRAERRAEEGEDKDEQEHLSFFSGGAGDTFYLVLAPDGRSLLNPQNLMLEGLPDPVTVQEATATGEAWRTVNAGGTAYRTYLLPVFEDGRAVAVVQVGRSLAERDRQLNSALLVLTISGAAGLALATVGGLIVAGRALAPARQAFSRQREFVADASHELRTPLALLRGNAEMLELSPTANLSEDDRQSLRDIVSEVEHMERLVRDLSMLARLDEGKLPLEHQSVNLTDIIDDVARQARILAAGRRLDIQASACPPLTVEGDPVRLRELLLILVDNAVRVTPDGGTLRLGGRVLDGHIEVQVSDTGPGIAPEHQERIFERFYRIDKARSRAPGGFGLGLSIARSVAEAHGGALTADSQGRGQPLPYGYQLLALPQLLKR